MTPELSDLLAQLADATSDKGLVNQLRELLTALLAPAPAAPAAPATPAS